MKKKIAKIILIIGLLTSAASIPGYFGQQFWILDIFAHFRLQYLVILILCLGGYLLLSNKKYIWLILPFVVLNAYEVMPVYWSVADPGEKESLLRVSSINLLNSNNDFEAVESYVRKNDPDILILQEFTDMWQENLEIVLAAYPFSLTIPREDNFGMGFFSKIELDTLRQISISKADIPSMLAKFKFAETDVTLVSIHPLPPSDQFRFLSRNHQFEQIREIKNRSTGEFILAGDLNTSPYSIHFKRMVSDLELQDTRKGSGVLPTWPTYFPLMMIPLDHCLISEGLYFRNRKVGPKIGSDHLPIQLDIGLK